MSSYTIELCEAFGVASVNQLTWAHSVCSVKDLEKALASDINLIEWDIKMGKYMPTVEIRPGTPTGQQ